SGFFDNERPEDDKSGMTEALAALEATLEIKKVPQEEKQCINHYVDPYEPPIPFPRRLEHHAEEALVHKTIESLKKIKINRPLLKEIRQTDNYTKHMKYLVENKLRTEEDEEIRMNPRCYALLQNHLPPKEQDLESFILPCSIGRLDLNNALADLGASISLMPLSMYKHLGIGKLEPINMVIEMADNTKCTLESYEEIVYWITKVEKEKYSAPKEKRVHWCKVILQEKENEHQYWASGNPNSNEKLSLNDWMKIRYGKVCKMTKERILKDHRRERFRDEENDLEENLEDSEECEEDKENAIMGAIHDKLNDDWFNNISEDEDDLEGILDYLEPRSYDGFIDLDDEAYNKRRAVVRLPDPKLITLGEKGIECIFVGYAEHFKTFRSLVHEIENIGCLVVPKKVIEEVVQQPEHELRKSKKNRTPKDFGSEFQLYLIKETRDEVYDQHSYCFNDEDDPKIFDEAMKSQDVAF
ncbi:hypothetical protein Tco_1210612, partial [Tanacetum coccineum]